MNENLILDSILKFLEHSIINCKNCLNNCHNFINTEISDIEESQFKTDLDYDTWLELSEYKEFEFENIKYLLNSAMIIVSYSYVESTFKKICKFLKKKIDLKLNVKDLYAESDIHRYKKYINKVANITTNQLKNEWENLNAYRKIRNLITHHNSNIYKEDQDLKNNPNDDVINYKTIIQNNSNYFELDEATGYFYIYDSTYIIKNCDNIYVYFSKLIDLIKSN